MDKFILIDVLYDIINPQREINLRECKMQELMGNDNSYQSLFIAVRYWLIGISQNDHQYIPALKALEYAKNIHIGLRKDGKTPEFQHQIEIVHYLRTLYTGLMYPGATFAAALLHDVPEDYDISFEEIEELFGKKISDAVRLLTKKHRGEKKEMELYFEEMAHCPIASVIKGGDRINNHQTMHPVFTKEKQISYITETKDFIIPMLKKAKHIHVEQEYIYENIKFILKSQMVMANHRLS
ncbi:HD domain-containing protein [archaeon]|nr:HD domain-containing protein [archaeon]NCQ50440.1 HD domain-containing protein [archaeon]